jgi:hypothetical protein
MKIHVAPQNDSVKTQAGIAARFCPATRRKTAKEMPCEGARRGQTAYMTGNMHPTKKHLPPQTIAPFVPGTVND